MSSDLAVVESQTQLRVRLSCQKFKISQICRHQRKFLEYSDLKRVIRRSCWNTKTVRLKIFYQTRTSIKMHQNIMFF